MKLFNKEKERELVVDFCERCGSVCDSACRSAETQARAGDAVVAYGPRLT
jgi:hypothetical protein